MTRLVRFKHEPQRSMYGDLVVQADDGVKLRLLFEDAQGVARWRTVGRYEVEDVQS